MATELTLEQLKEFGKRRNAALTRGDYSFQFLDRWWVLGEKGEISYSYPVPEGQTHEAIANMRVLLPMMVKLLQQPHVHESLIMQGQSVNWDVVNDMERQCGLPKTPCPDSVATQKLGLNKEKGSPDRSE
jgi:hypothetical protein